MEARAISRYVRIAPRKMILVADLVRGKSVNEALSILHFSPKNRPESEIFQNSCSWTTFGKKFYTKA